MLAILVFMMFIRGFPDDQFAINIVKILAIMLAFIEFYIVCPKIL